MAKKAADPVLKVIQGIHFTSGTFALFAAIVLAAIWFFAVVFMSGWSS